MRIYIAGKMTDIELWNYPAFDLTARWLRSEGHDAVSPAELSRDAGFSEHYPAHEFTDAHYHETMLRNYAALLTCDAIAFMPGWETSKGARLERDLADRIGLPMYRVDAANVCLEREIIIGIGGYGRSGKDTLAGLMVEHLGFERRAFADALKRTLYFTNPAVNVDGRYIPLQSVIDDLGWDDAKTYHPEIRGIQQRLGTEGARNNIDSDVWVKAVLDKPHGPRLAIPDTRFPNESDDIHRRGGYVVLVERDGVGPVNDHVSEALDINPDIVIKNDGKPEDMLGPISEFLDSVR